MNVTEMLERIAKLPSEWRHPLALKASAAIEVADGEGMTSLSDDDTLSIALDLHLRTIAERLAEGPGNVYRNNAGAWVADTDGPVLIGIDTYALALLSAAEAVVKEGGG